MPEHWKQHKPGSEAWKRAKREHKLLELVGSGKKSRRTGKRKRPRVDEYLTSRDVPGDDFTRTNYRQSITGYTVNPKRKKPKPS